MIKRTVSYHKHKYNVSMQFKTEISDQEENIYLLPNYLREVEKLDNVLHN